MKTEPAMIKRKPYAGKSGVRFIFLTAVGAAAGAFAGAAIAGSPAGGTFDSVSAVIDGAVNAGMGSAVDILAFLFAFAGGAFSGIAAVIAIMSPAAGIIGSAG